MVLAECLPVLNHVHSFNPYNKSHRETIVISILEIIKLRYGEVDNLHIIAELVNGVVRFKSKHI